MTPARRILRSLVVLAIVAAFVGSATFAAFRGTTANPNDSFTAGTVAIGDNDAAAAVMNLTAAAPAQNSTGCIAVTYTGTLDAGVRLYASLTGTLGPYLTLTVTRGSIPTPSFPSCTGFTADATDYLGLGAGVIYSGLLSAFPTSYATGIVDPLAATPETWITSESHVYRFSVTLVNDNQAQGRSQSADFTWEARNL